MNIAAKIRESVLSDARTLELTDEKSVTVLAIARLAQAALEAEVEALTSTGASVERVANYRAMRTGQLNEWIKSESAKISTGGTASANSVCGNEN